MPGVSFYVVALASAMVYTDIPLRAMIVNALMYIAYIVMVFLVKTPEVRQIELWNAIPFLAVQLIASYLGSEYMAKTYCHHLEMKRLSNQDILTDTLNRNSCQNALQPFAKQCKESATCVFFDVNGLHELNNTKGHAAGDEMLRYTASRLQRYFGRERVYRIGGDEFTVLLADCTTSWL